MAVKPARIQMSVDPTDGQILSVQAEYEGLPPNVKVELQVLVLGTNVGYVIAEGKTNSKGTVKMDTDLFRKPMPSSVMYRHLPAALRLTSPVEEQEATYYTRINLQSGLKVYHVRPHLRAGLGVILWNMNPLNSMWLLDRRYFANARMEDTD